MIAWVVRRRRDERGSVAIIVAMMMTALFLAGAFAIDLGTVLKLHNQAQTAVDDAALSAAALYAQNTNVNTAVAQAETYLTQNFPFSGTPDWNSCPTPAPSGYSVPSGVTQTEDCITFNSAMTAVNVQLPPQVAKYSLARAAHLTGATVETSATARITGGAAGTLPCAICLLSPAGKGVTDKNGDVVDADVEGSSKIYVTSTDTGAGIWIDGGSPAAFVSGTSQICTASQQLGQSCPGTCPDSTATSTRPPIYVVTSSSFDNPSTCYYPNPTSETTGVSDPLAYLPAVTPASTTVPSASYTATKSGNVTLTAGQYGSVDSGSCSGCQVTIPPGTYSNLTAEGSGNLTLEPGTYVITGSFLLNGAGTVTEQPGVLLYFTCSTTSGSNTTVSACSASGQAGGSLSITAGSAMTWSPMTTGTYANLAVFYDRHDTSAITSNGYTSFAFQGTLYAASAPLIVQGSGAALSSLIVVGAIQATGNTPVSVTYTSTQNVPGQTLPGSSYLCSIAASNC